MVTSDEETISSDTQKRIHQIKKGKRIQLEDHSRNYILVYENEKPKKPGKNARKNTIIWDNDHILLQQLRIQRAIKPRNKIIIGYQESGAQKIKGLQNCCITFHMIYPTIMIMVGLSKLDSCPVNANIPLYLIFAGILGWAYAINDLYFHSFKTNLIMLCLIFGWFVFVATNVLAEYEPDFFEAGMRYCDRFLYRFCFYTGFVQVFVMFLFVVYLCFSYAFNE